MLFRASPPTLALLFVLLHFEPAHGAVVAPGQVFAGDSNLGLFQFGEQGVKLFSDTVLQSPMDIAIESDQSLLIAQRTLTNGPGSVVRVNPATGAASVVSSGGLLNTPRGIVIEASGHIVVSNNQDGTIVRVDPITGDQELVFSNGLGGVFDITLDSSGDIFATVEGSVIGTPGSVLRINPLDGSRSTVAQGGFFQRPFGLSIGPDGDVFVADRIADALIRVDPDTSSQSIFFVGEGPGRFSFLDFDDEGKIVAARGS